MYDYLITERPNKIPLKTQLLAVLWIMATPDCFRSVASCFNMNRGTLHKIYRNVICIMVKIAHKYIKWPNDQQKEIVRALFFNFYFIIFIKI